MTAIRVSRWVSRGRGERRSRHADASPRTSAPRRVSSPSGGHPSILYRKHTPYAPPGLPVRTSELRILPPVSAHRRRLLACALRGDVQQGLGTRWCRIRFARARCVCAWVWCARRSTICAAARRRGSRAEWLARRLAGRTCRRSLG